MPVITGLSATDRELLLLDLATHHEFRRTVQIWTRDHELVEDVSDVHCTGQVDVDTSREVSRGALVDLFDPSHAVGFDTASASVGTVAPKYMLHTKVGILGPNLGRWFDVATFTGPIGRPNREGDLLKIEAQGKEALASKNLYEPYKIKAGTKKGQAIADVMRLRSGEQFFRLEATSAKVEKDLSFGRDRTPWSIAKEIADSMGWQLFYAADGYLVCRPRSATPVFTFRTGTGGMVLTEPQIGSVDDYVTGVLGTGGTPKGKKEPITAVAFPPASHPMSPQSLARGGYPDYSMLEVTNDEIKKKPALQKWVNEQLAIALLDNVAYASDVMMNPLLEEDDAFTHVDHISGIETVATASRFTLPLEHGAPCPLGYNKRVTRSVRPVKNLA